VALTFWIPASILPQILPYPKDHHSHRTKSLTSSLSLNITHTKHTTHFYDTITCIKQTHTLTTTRKNWNLHQLPFFCHLLHFGCTDPFSFIRFYLHPEFRSTSFHPITCYRLNGGSPVLCFSKVKLIIWNSCVESTKVLWYSCFNSLDRGVLHKVFLFFYHNMLMTQLF
jgi:hypothetical protein